MFLAAGLGTRLRPFTDVTAKPMLPLLGVPVAQFAFDGFAAAGARKVVANVHWLASETETGLRSLERLGFDLEISDESDRVLGSAGGPRKALARLGAGDFVYFNGDMLTDVDLPALAKRHQELRMAFGARITLAIGRPPDARGSYTEIVVDRGAGSVRGLGARSASQPFFLGVAIMDSGLFSDLAEDEPHELVPSVLKPALERGEVGFYLHEGSWFDIGSPAEWLATHLKLIDLLAKGELPAAWATRLESTIERARDGIYVSRGSGAPGRGSSAPAFWSGRGEDPPAALGPAAVLYGRPPEGTQESLRSGIGYGGHWVPVAVSGV